MRDAPLEVGSLAGSGAPVTKSATDTAEVAVLSSAVGPSCNAGGVSEAVAGSEQSVARSEVLFDNSSSSAVLATMACLRACDIGSCAANVVVVVVVVGNSGISVVMVFVVESTSLNILAVELSDKSRDLCPVVVVGNSGICVVVVEYVVNSTSLNIRAVVLSVKSRDLCPVVVVGSSGINVVMVFVVDSTSLNILSVVFSVKSRDLCSVVVVVGSSVIFVLMVVVVDSTSLNILAVELSNKSRDLCPVVVVVGNSGISVVMVFVVDSTSLNILAVELSDKSRDLCPVVVGNSGISVVMVFVVDSTSINILAVELSVKSRDLCPVVVVGSSGISVVMVFVVDSTSLNILAAEFSVKFCNLCLVVFVADIVVVSSGNSMVVEYVVMSLYVVESCCVSCTSLIGSEFRNSSYVTAGPDSCSCVTSGPLVAGIVCMLVTASSGSGSCTLVLSDGPSVAPAFCFRDPTAPGGSEFVSVFVRSVRPEVGLLASFRRPEPGRDVNCPSSVVRKNVGSFSSVVEGVMVVLEFGNGTTGSSFPATKARQQASTHVTARTLWK